MERFSIPKLVEDVEKYNYYKKRFYSFKKKSERWIIGFLYKNRVESAYLEYINFMRILEVKYNPKHPFYQQNHFNQNINISHPKSRLEVNRPSPIFIPKPSAPSLEQLSLNQPFIHH